MSGSPVSPSLLVSLAATPWLVAIVAIRAAGEGLKRLGVASEEIFRGDRLPILHVSERVVAETDRLEE
jgi:hypothetical protein